MTLKYVTYRRVSTKEQGRSGHGLDGQQRDIELYLQNYSESPYKIIGDFVEVESGTNNDRVEFNKAVHLAKKEDAVLLVAKLDRLSRKVSFISSLMDDKNLQIKVCSMPNADNFQLHIYAALAEQEREFISMRTKAGLEAAKAKGVKLGGLRDKTNARNQAKRKQADLFAKKVWSVIEPMHQAGLNYSQIAKRLASIGMKTSTGKGYAPQTVKNIISRMNN
ncbi:recombinase family protein [Thalassotalea sp. G2M2-11]|uniref:recombinase family protein n=1 Tax=Thalassotalea sp. G2M2-11 TaxID=2787627 RepID=UPI0019D26071|nr:recombinase family protein [Thalassotalea sp. G2M2-11]